MCSRYDAHLILSAVKPRHGKITVIPKNMECSTSFTINDVTFIDSCQFMQFMREASTSYPATRAKTNSGRPEKI